MTSQAYIRAVRDLYTRLPQTSKRFNRSDRQLAEDLYPRNVSFDTLRSALLLATARRLCRNPANSPLPPVRSLHYFLPVLDEILHQPLPRGYVQYLEYKIAEPQ